MKPSEKDFIAESGEIIEEASGLLIEIQETLLRGVNPDIINALFRAVHTLKGTAGLFGYQEVTDISHAIETLLDDIRMGRVELSEAVVEFLFKYVDVLKYLAGEPKDAALEISEYLDEINSFRESMRVGAETAGLPGAIDEAILRVLSEYEEHRLKVNIKEGKGIYLTRAAFSIDVFDVALKELTGKIKAAGELISTMPTTGDLPPGSIGFNLMFGSSRPVDEIMSLTNFDTMALVEARQAEEPAALDKGPSLKTAAATTVRVDIEKLDRILNTISELSLAKGAAKRIWTEMTERYGHTPLGVDMYRITQTLQRRVSELQEQVLDIRMVPVGQIFGRLSQVIRRYSREVERKIELTIFGEDTEIDKYVAEEIVDPLVHIVRNAIDHGIESEEERRRCGKKEAGSVTLRAMQRGNNVVIDVQDDGRGIDVEKIRRMAVEKGIIKAGDELQRGELIDLIFTPGFSTKEAVTEVSGRGFGTDIVKEKVSALGGFVGVDTEESRGTTFTLTLPITLAIIKCLVVRVGQERFAVPLSSISETLAFQRESMQTIEHRRVYNLRGEVLPVKNLGELFDLPSDNPDRPLAVVLGIGERKLGLLVDELLGQQEVVIKSLGDYFVGQKGFAGAAEIGRHELILVLDVDAVIEGSTGKDSLCTKISTA